MPVIPRSMSRRLADESGFTMILAIGVLAVTTLLIAALFVAIDGDIHISQHDLDGKRAYSAAEAGAAAFLYQLNQNPNYWLSCSNDSLAKTQVPNSSPAVYYSYQVVPANGNASCNNSNPISSLIDNSTGSLRMEFTGYSGCTMINNVCVPVTRTIVASYRKLTPLDFLWYTVYEALDDSITGYGNCGTFYRSGRNSACNINWVTGDVMNGPMYTQDQYLVLGSPTFGRGPDDKIESLAPGSSAKYVCAADNCGSATFKGTAVWSAPLVPLPSDNSQLEVDASTHGKVYSGTTTITLSGNSATVKNCPTGSCTTTSVDLTQYPIIYVANDSLCTSPPAYDPFDPFISATGHCGDVYIKGSYTTPVTIAAANNIIVNGSITTTETNNIPSGGAVLGLIANQDVRVEHQLTDDCPTNDSSNSFTNIKIDAAILSLKHSFIVDNYNCGAPLGTLTVNGAIIQYFRGAVGTVNGSGQVQTGYLKNYTYDDRLAYLLPPYLFDISNGGWEVNRQTLCTNNAAPGDPNAC
jgi:hypothetical protein